MHAGGGEAEDDVAFGNVAGRQQLAALGRTHGKAREVVVAVRIHARHFGGLAADQRAASLAAALGDALHDRRTLVRVELAGGEVVEEEQRLGTLHHEIVDAHGDEVDADGVVAVGVDGDLQLGANTVIGRHQDRIREAGGLEIEQAAEAADLTIRARAARRAHGRLDLLDHQVAGIDIDTCIAIGQTVLLRLAHALVSGFRLFAPDWHDGTASASRMPGKPGFFHRFAHSCDRKNSRAIWGNRGKRLAGSTYSRRALTFLRPASYLLI